AAQSRGADGRRDAGADREDADLDFVRLGARDEWKSADARRRAAGHHTLEERPPRRAHAVLLCTHFLPLSSSRTIFAPATRRFSFSAATQRGTGKNPQSGMAESFSAG